MKLDRKIYLLLLAGLLLRLGIFYFQYSGDIKNHLVWGNGFLESPLGFFGRHFPGFNDPNYPPLAIFLFALSNLLYQNLVLVINSLNSVLPVFPSSLVPLFASENMSMAFLKLPAIFADLMAGLVLYKILLSRKSSKPLLITSAFLFNPALIYISTVWGQIESITILFLLYSLYLAISPKSSHTWGSIFVFALGSLVKQTTLWFAPVYLFLWFKELGKSQMIKGVLSGVSVFFLSYLPFGLLPLSAMRHYLSTLSGSSNLISDAAWNLWFLFLRLPSTPDTLNLGFLTVRQASIICLFLTLSLLYFYLFKKYTLDRLFISLFIWSLAVFFLQTRVHERHLSFSLAFILLLPGISSRYFLDYLLLSAFHYWNLVTVQKLPFIR